MFGLIRDLIVFDFHSLEKRDFQLIGVHFETFEIQLGKFGTN